jgi:plastocyanin
MTDPKSRRSVLTSAGTAGAIALAGCLGNAGTGEDPTDDGHDDEHDDDHGTGTRTHHDDEHSHDGVEGPAAAAEVRMITTDAGHHFDPHVVWVEAGGTVTWVNESGSHSVEAYAPANDTVRRIPEGAAAFESDLYTESGAEFEHTFEEPGVYDYYCEPHEGVGMIGSVIVGEPDAHGQPGLAEAQDELPEGTHEKIHSLNDKVNEALGHGHDESTATESGHDGEDGHHDETATDDGHDGEDGHHDETATDDGHHDETATDDGHHD